VTPTSIKATGLKALAISSSGVSIAWGSCQPVQANSKPASKGSVTGCQMLFLRALSTVASAWRGAAPGNCSRATASSSITVALVNSTKECTVTSVSSVTSPAGP
jgi:hypothetical protein